MCTFMQVSAFFDFASISPLTRRGGLICNSSTVIFAAPGRSELSGREVERLNAGMEECTLLDVGPLCIILSFTKKNVKVPQFRMFKVLPCLIQLYFFIAMGEQNPIVFTHIGNA